MKTTVSHSITRRTCVALCAAAALVLPLAAQAQPLQEITYLLPAPANRRLSSVLPVRLAAAAARMRPFSTLALKV